MWWLILLYGSYEQGTHFASVIKIPVYTEHGKGKKKSGGS